MTRSSESEPEPESRIRPWARRLAIRLARGSGESAEDCDDAGFVDSEGDTCRNYVDLGWCTPEGGYGPPWGEDWGEFSDYANSDGLSAPEVCCGCGG